MGYTVTIHPTSPKLGREMLAFMTQHLRTLTEITGEDTEEYFYGPVAVEDLSYCSRRGHIGFDYKSGDPDRSWVYMLIHWMAIKIGRRSESGNAQYFYDGCEWMDIDPKKYDRLGRPRASLVRRMMGHVLHKYSANLLHAEIARLDKLWNRQHTA